VGYGEATGGLMRANDVTFTINAGEAKGKAYGFTLADTGGKKAWEVTRVFRLPPSMVKYRIKMVITVREENIGGSGARELMRVEKIIEALEQIMEQNTPVTLKGFDKQKYAVLMDNEAGITTQTIIHEKERQPEYQATVLCWGLCT